MSALAFSACLLAGLLITAAVLWRHPGLIVIYPISVSLAVFVAYHASRIHAVSNAFLFAGICYFNTGLFILAKRMGSFDRLGSVFRQWFSIEARKGDEIVARKAPAPPPAYERVPQVLIAGVLLLAISALFAFLS